MIYFTREAQEKLDKLFYYPYTFGKHIDKANRDLRTIEMSIPHLPLRLGTHSVTIRGIGSFTYLCNGNDVFIQFITWNTLLTNFYYKKSNFIVFTSSSNIASVHPALYTDRNEPSFICDNGFKVVSRFVTIRGKRTEVFNFKNLNGYIVCDIDFIQVKPFDEYKDMTARGYTPNRRCYMVFEDGYKEEVNESRNTRLESIINECVDRCLRKYLNENTKYSIPKFLYHATPSCYLSSIKKNGLGGKIPRIRFWDYDNTEYANIKKGCFLATDEYVAESYLEASDEFEYFSEWYEERYDKELNIVVFKIPTSNLDIRLLKIDKNQLIDDETEPTYFYDGVIPYNQMSIIQLY